VTDPRALSQSRRVCILFFVQVVFYSALIYFTRWLIPYGTRLGPLTWSDDLADGIEAWSVALAGVTSVIAATGSLSDLGFRYAALRYFAIACSLPFAYWSAIYLPAWLFGLASFRGLPIILYAIASSVAHLPNHLALAAGEEIGWRGALTPSLARLVGWTRAGLLCGLFWAVWHYGDIVYFDFNVGTPFPYEIACFTISVIGLSMFQTWLRRASSSVWPPVVFHGVHNSVLYGIFDRSTQPGPDSALFVTEFGAGLTVAASIVGVASWLALQNSETGAAT
jgi:uncharacterized protein